jgi:uncharacterized protein with von Willebrand factor type A (vWA) domain
MDMFSGTAALIPVEQEDVAWAVASVGANHDYDDLSRLNAANLSGRSPQQVAELKRKIAFVFGVSSGEFDFEILPHPLNWACGFSPEASQVLDELMKGNRGAVEALPDEAFRPNAFFYHTDEIVNRPEVEIAGITHHEAAHAEFTDYRVFIEGMFNASHEGALQSIWANVFNGVEDGRINRLKSASSVAGNKYLGDLYQVWVEEVRENISIQPILHQFALNCVHRWATGHDIEQITDSRVRDLIDATRDGVDRYIGSDDAVMAGQIMSQDIWPEARKLAEEQIRDQALNDLRSDREGSAFGKLKSFIKRMCGGESEKKEITASERVKLEKAFEKLADSERESRLQRARSEVDEQMAEIHNREGLKGFRLERDDESEEYRVEREEPPTQEETQALRDILQDALDDTREEQRNRESAEAERQRAKREREQAGFEEEEDQEYAVYMADSEAIASILDRFIENLHKVLPRDVERLLEGEYLSGARLDKLLLSRRAPVLDGRVFQRRYSRVSTEPLVDLVVLIDNSGSMEGEKILNARRTALLLLHACERLSIPCSIRLFGSRDQVIKSREESLDTPGNRVHHRLVTTLDARGGGTNIGTPLTKEHAGIRVFRQSSPKTQSAVFVVSDSGANEGAVGAELERIVRALRGDAVVVNFILSGDEADVGNCRNVFGSQNVVEAPEVGSLAHRMLTSLTRIFFEAAQRRR